MSANELKQLVHKELEQLPPDRLQEVLEFVRWLRRRSILGPAGQEATGKPWAMDPMSELVGLVAHGRLAHAIDEELYGA